MKSAVISGCEKYRYRLDRTVGVDGPVYAFFGINPSTADALEDDATVRKWNGFVSRWGGSRYLVGNVFAYRATDVRDLARAGDPVGPANAWHVRDIVQEADILVPCWGNSRKIPHRLWRHLARFESLLRDTGKPIRIFGLTLSGDPKHPLMMPYSTPLREWEQ